MKLLYSPEADNDMAKIHAYIANDLEDVLAAQRISGQILQHVELLMDFPQLGKEIENAEGVPVGARMLVADRYLILYRHDEHQVMVLRIVNALLDYTRLT